MQQEQRSKRKTPKKIAASRKKEHRFEELHRHLRRYVDYDPKSFWMATAESFNGIPKTFFARAESWTTCAITVNWENVKVALVGIARIYGETVKGRSLTQNEIERITNRIRAEHLMHVVEHLPVAFDSAMWELCFEALVARADPQRLTGLASSASEVILKLEERKIKTRLGVRAGPRTGLKRHTAEEVKRIYKDHSEKIEKAILKLYGRDNYGGSYHKSAVAKEIKISTKTLTEWLKNIGVKSGKRAFEKFVENILQKKNRKL